jgi:hypothetical protein
VLILAGPTSARSTPTRTWIAEDGTARSTGEVVGNRAGVESAVADDNHDEGPRTWCWLDQRCDEGTRVKEQPACRRPAPSCPCTEGAGRLSLILMAGPAGGLRLPSGPGNDTTVT